MNLLEAPCSRKSIYRLLTHSSCCRQLPTAFEATLTSLLPQPPSSNSILKNRSLPQVLRDFRVFSFLHQTAHLETVNRNPQRILCSVTCLTLLLKEEVAESFCKAWIAITTTKLTSFILLFEATIF